MRDEAAAYVPNAIEWGRLYRVLKDLIRGFHMLKRYKVAATIFGSARSQMPPEIYQIAHDLAARLARDGFTIITGGGPGIMEAANRGAKEAGGYSVGFNVELPFEQKPNRYLTDTRTLHYFFTRKVLMAFSSEVYIFFPGGFGTMDELFEMMTLVQTRRMQRIPIILVGKEYWTPLLEWITHTMLGSMHTISEADLSIYHLVDSTEEAYARILELVPDEKLRYAKRTPQGGAEQPLADAGEGRAKC